MKQSHCSHVRLRQIGMCRSTLIRRNIGNFLNYSVLLLVLAVSASYGLVMVTNPHFYVDAIESHRADVFTQGDILPRDSSPTPIIAAYPSISSMLSFSIRHKVYTLATIPRPVCTIIRLEHQSIQHPRWGRTDSVQP